ncbi:MAG: hypothetical protein ACLUOF_01050 [Ruminococcus sp.]
MPRSDERLIPYGILLRHCDNYVGLGVDDYRAAVRLPEENAYLLRCCGRLWRRFYCGGKIADGAGDHVLCRKKLYHCRAVPHLSAGRLENRAI